jgi:three-Cys-motif partner protein
VPDHYLGREQTKAKHFILKRYLQALAFKVLRFSDMTYVDGFSGPWRTQSEDFADTSFMIAIDVLRDAQRRIIEQTSSRPRIGRFFSENDPKVFAQLAAAVSQFHRPDEGFEIKTYCGDFEDAVPEIQAFVGRSFPLIFIDPTGWTGYPFDKIRPLFERPKCEVLINFMYDFVNRAVFMRDAKTIASLNPILGGPNWEARLDLSQPRGLAVEKLFRDTLRKIGGFEFVVSTKIDRSTTDRPHFFLAYGTKSLAGLEAFRDTEYAALRAHARDRADAKERKREDKYGLRDLFPGNLADAQEATIDDIVAEQKALAADDLLATLSSSGPQHFSQVWPALLQTCMLRVTNVKDVCVELARRGAIENTWGGGNRKPRDDHLIRLNEQSV